MEEVHHFTRVVFRRFKAFDTFELSIRRFNILVGPNNAGKSTVLAAFRILFVALRKAASRNPEIVPGPNGQAYGYRVDLEAVSVASENLFYNYDDSNPATVRFFISNGNEILLYFPEPGACYMFLQTKAAPARSTKAVKNHFNCQVGFVPILGPVEHHETLYEREAARLALHSYSSARNFRNIWYHFPDKFEIFRSLLSQTWPGMDVQRPTVDISHQKPRLHMFCPEERRPREIFWSGFGFQVWCQMLTHVIQGSDGRALFLIDEPDIYLHADLQRQLLNLLRNLGPDILIATHSTEMIADAEPDDIVVINKKRRAARRISQPTQLVDVFSSLGSQLNPTLTQLAKTRRVVFVEGHDFQIITRFAAKIGANAVSNRGTFAVVPVRGFNPSRIRDLREGMQSTLGTTIQAMAIFDRDYRSDDECEMIRKECLAFCDHVVVHWRKEIENFLLVPSALDRAAKRRISERTKRTGRASAYGSSAAEVLMNFAIDRKSYVTAQVLETRRLFERSRSSAQHNAATTEAALMAFEDRWKMPEDRLRCIPGKEAVSAFNRHLQECLTSA